MIIFSCIAKELKSRLDQDIPILQRYPYFRTYFSASQQYEYNEHVSFRCHFFTLSFRDVARICFTTRNEVFSTNASLAAWPLQ